MSEELKVLESKLAQPELSKQDIVEGLEARFFLTLRGYHQKTGIESDPADIKNKLKGYFEAGFKEVGVARDQASREQFEKVKEIVDYEIQLFRIDVVDGDLSEEHNRMCDELLSKFPAS